MERIGIRELRQNASRYIDKVKSGAVIEVTERGTAVARLVPLDAGEDIRSAMIARGEIAPAAARRRPLVVADLPAGDLTEVLQRAQGVR
ncbi:MAG: type II toxin-antitoxin system prevent-host-death family antitoxin [Rhodococcus sp. (in: high G+C Gram-positive bacteria)]|uniref:type II toxin-antitoxin system Phd/YefM family antitoxin n=1 Tax=Rhodococcus sp. TaxID=1831 RepID=UPI003BAFB2FE